MLKSAHLVGMCFISTLSKCNVGDGRQCIRLLARPDADATGAPKPNPAHFSDDERSATAVAALGIGFH